MNRTQAVFDQSFGNLWTSDSVNDRSLSENPQPQYHLQSYNHRIDDVGSAMAVGFLSPRRAICFYQNPTCFAEMK